MATGNCEDLTLDPQHPYKSQVGWHISVTPVVGAEADGFLEFIGQLAKSMSPSFSDKLCLKKSVENC